ncbi:MAG: flagellar basal body-associated FliL family protein [Actinomycetes bacterium]
MAKKDAEASSDEQPEKGKKGKKKLLLIMLLVVLLGGGAAGYLVLGPSGGKAAAATKPAPEPGAVVARDPLDINLPGGPIRKGGRARPVTKDAGAEEPNGSRALDLAITEFSGANMTKLAKTAERDKAKAELLDKLKEAYEDKVMDVYFTQFVMQ